MTDDQPTGSCPTCQRRDARTPQLCDVCRSRLRSFLADVPDLYSQLLAEEYDGLAGSKAGGRVSGSKERRLPIDTDAVDLTGPVRSAGVAVLDEDAVGYESVATVLDFWIEDWRALRGAGERRPSATVPELTRWLLDRLDDAMDSAPAVVEFYEAVRRLRNALNTALRRFDIPDYKRFTPCPRCFSLSLVHHGGSEFIECSTCPAVLSFLEYDDHARSLSAEYEQARRVKVAQIKAVRRLLEALRVAGWRHSLRYEERTLGSEFGDDACRVHVWRRGSEQIEHWILIDSGASLGHFWYTYDDSSLSVSTEWVDDNGIPALQKLARAAGFLTAPKRAGVSADHG